MSRSRPLKGGGGAIRKTPVDRVARSNQFPMQFMCHRRIDDTLNHFSTRCFVYSSARGVIVFFLHQDLCRPSMFGVILGSILHGMTRRSGGVGLAIYRRRAVSIIVITTSVTIFKLLVFFESATIRLPLNHCKYTFIHVVAEHFTLIRWSPRRDDHHHHYKWHRFFHELCKSFLPATFINWII